MHHVIENPVYIARLLDRFRRGESEAVSTLFEMYVDRVYGFAFHLLGNREDSEDVVTETFFNAFRKAQSFRGDCPFDRWLFAIARNLCRDRHRQPKLILIGIEDCDLQTLGLDPFDLDVKAAFANISDDYQEVLLLCDVQQWDAKEASEILGRTVESTKSLLYRARRALRQSLTDLWKDDINN